MKPAAPLVLYVAIVSEVVGTAGLKASERFSRVVPVLVVVVAYGAAFYILSLSLEQIPLGVAYAIWSGLGTVRAVLVGVIVWQESLGLAWLESALEHAFARGEMVLVAYLEEVMDEVLFEMELDASI